MHEAIVVGGGITGLACTFRLQKLGIPVLLLEASDRLGGVVDTVEQRGFLFEAGPQCPRFPPILQELVRDLGLERRFLRADRRARRYILKDGRLFPAPFSPFGLLSTPLVGLNSKFRLLSEAFRHSHPPAEEETLADFVHRKFGQEILNYLVDPLVSCVLAADPEKLGMESAFPALVRWERDHGSLVRGAIKSREASSQPQSSPSASHPDANSPRSGLHVSQSLPPLGSFDRGLGALPLALQEKLGSSVRLGACAEYIEPICSNGRPEPAWRIGLATGSAVESVAIVIATPAYEAARLFLKAAPTLGSLLASVSYAPMAVVSAGYNQAQIGRPLRGFGLLVPRCEGLETLCTIWNSSLLPGRTPEGKVMLTSFVGGATNPALEEKNPETIANIVENEVGRILRISGPPVERIVWKYPKALPQFNLGHAQQVAAIEESLERLPGVFLAGNYLHGRSLGECVDLAYRAADGVRAFLPH